MLAKYVYIAVAVGALAIVAGAYVKGRSDASAKAEADTRGKIVDQLTERNQIDDKIKSLSAGQLCVRLGGVWRDERCE